MQNTSRSIIKSLSPTKNLQILYQGYDSIYRGLRDRSLFIPGVGTEEKRK
jgi:hypothetical protein